MDVVHFDRWTRRLAASIFGRRTVALGLLSLLAVASGAVESTAARGCKRDGAKCKRNRDCCSGKCRRHKRKKRHCVSQFRGCQAGQSEAYCGGSDVFCTSPSGAIGICNTTTSGEGYCTVGIGCFACTEDADCVPSGGAGSACIRCPALCPDTGGTACASPT
jgi:hypothetical protein